MAKKRKSAVAAAGFALLLAGGHPSIAMTVEDLYGACVSADRNVQDVCSKYILGAAEGISKAALLLNDQSLFCLPENVPEGVLVDVFVREVRPILADASKSVGRMSAISFVASALMTAFPCHQ
jgi:hypothetical protein